MISNTSEHQSILGQNPRWLKVCLLIMFVLATLIRRDEIKASGHLLDREYTSAIFARAYYFTNNSAVEDWRREIAVTAKNQQPVLEPPLLDYMISIIYRIIGREELHYARYLTNAFWLLGGIFMFLIARKLLSPDEAIITTAYYLFVPMGIIISRSIQPDSLMMMLFLASLYAVMLYFETYSTRYFLLASFLNGITLLLRPLVLFAIFAAFLAFSFHHHRTPKKIIDPPLFLFSTISLLPVGFYYGYGIIFAGFMRWKISTSFMPYLLTKVDFWMGWFNNIMDVAELTPLFLAVAGFFLIKKTRTRYLILALTAAFILFSIAFTYHIHTHPYYHIQLFPIIGLCIAPVLVRGIKILLETNGRYGWLPIAVIVLLGLYASHREVRGSLYKARLEDPATAWEIGEAIGHSPHTVYVAFYYGIPLIYYGEFGGAPWPVRIEDEFYRPPDARELLVQERLDGLGFTPEYFVITNFDLYNRKHQDLQTYLEDNCMIIAQTERYLIYGSCQNSAEMKTLSSYQQNEESTVYPHYL